MLGSQPSSLQVMNPDAAGIKRRIVPGNQRYRQRMLLKRLKQLAMGYARPDDHAIHLLLPQQINVPLYFLFLVVRAADDHAVTELMLILDGAGNLGKTGWRYRERAIQA